MHIRLYGYRVINILETLFIEYDIDIDVTALQSTIREWASVAVIRAANEAHKLRTTILEHTDPTKALNKRSEYAEAESHCSARRCHAKLPWARVTMIDNFK